MSIPFADIKKQYYSIKTEIDDAIMEVLKDTAFIRGKYVDRFEKTFSTMYGIKHCIGVGNGTDAIYLALKALEIGPGDEVITVCNSWISTSEVISQAGANVKFVDIEPENYNINVDKIEAVINENTKAIIPVHLYGQPVKDFDKLISLAKKHSLYVIEDCAQAIFAKYKNQHVGTFGDVATISFYPGKNLGAFGDAGAVISNNDDLAQKIRMLANHGQSIKHIHTYEGINSRMDGIQGNVLNAKLNHILHWTSRRQEIAEHYNSLLENIDYLDIPNVDSNSSHVFHLYVILAKERDKLKEYLAKNGIGTALHYPTILPLLDCYKHLNYSESDFPVGFNNSKKILSLPMFPELSNDEIEYICDKIKRFYG
ncbi:MAG: erythromycin biosynthesis sensory transduction protein eryC1 [Rickettsiales bacterium]|nr:erythromycin biosynthesis sensory transduction protein eryC1 [Rickettsiales bacterium]